MLRVLRTMSLLSCLLLASCFGTFLSRVPGWQVDEDAGMFGWPLFGAVHADYGVVAEGLSGHNSVFWFMAAFGWPVDMVVDLVLLPLDVIGGVMGQSKSHYESPGGW